MGRNSDRPFALGLAGMGDAMKNKLEINRLTKITRFYARNGKYRSVRGSYTIRNNKHIFVRAGDMVGDLVIKSANESSPESRLISSIIAQAANDYLSPDHFTKEKDESDACHFLFVDPYMFELCDAIGVDGSYVRGIVDFLDGGING